MQMNGLLLKSESGISSRDSCDKYCGLFICASWRFTGLASRLLSAVRRLLRGCWIGS